MEFVEEESRPRFLFQSRPSSSSATSSQTLAPTKLHIISCFIVSFLLLFLSFSLFSNFQTLNFLLIWTSISLLIAPFAPSAATAGDPRVGLGDPLPPPDPTIPEPILSSSRRARTRKPDNPIPALIHVDPTPDPTRNQPIKEEVTMNESEWTEEDFEMLKKQISKHPSGEPKRWEKIAAAFCGRHGVDSVITTAKSLSAKRPEDSFAQFLKQRKPVDKRVEEMEGELNGMVLGGVWSSGEDIALLNALKAFPKEVAMRWEKVAAAVPGRSKAECVKRVAELKKDFRSSKA